MTETITHIHYMDCQENTWVDSSTLVSQAVSSRTFFSAVLASFCSACKFAPTCACAPMDNASHKRNKHKLVQQHAC